MLIRYGSRRDCQIARGLISSTVVRLVDSPYQARYSGINGTWTRVPVGCEKGRVGTKSMQPGISQISAKHVSDIA